MEIVLDFDGTVVTHAFPEIGEEIGAVPVLRKLVKNGHKLILFTMRSDVTNPKSEDEDIVCLPGQYLTDAVNWFKKNDIPLYGIQTNPNQHHWTSSPKAYGQIIIDDTALGAPLTVNLLKSKRAYIDWQMVEYFLTKQGLLQKPKEDCNYFKDEIVNWDVSNVKQGAIFDASKERTQEKCTHRNIEEIQGGQIERCRKCGKEWGDK